ncbi:MAG: hypothetical protein EPO07_14915 [Verrucomicrobia bacterium]|nr:MAG: hypothetical protein EPO07_14915 [Verrucomicrobiota bacterium]
MGILKFFSKPAIVPRRLPNGSFTVDRDGHLVVATLPSSFPVALLEEIGALVLKTFVEAQAIQLPLSEVNVHFGSLKLSARELRGGAIVFLSPVTPITATANP